MNPCDTTSEFGSKPECTSPTTYCISESSGTIHAVAGSAGSFTCKNAALNSGVHVFKVDSTITELNLANELDDDDADADKLAVYVCDSDKKCTQTFGYVKIKNNYYSISASDASAKIDEDGFVTDCVLAEFGKIDSTNKVFCTGDRKSIPISSTSANYIIPNADSNIFTGGDVDTMIYVKTIQNNILLNNIDGKYKLYF